MLRRAGKCKKSNAALGGKMQKNAVFIGENDIFYLEKNEANWQFRIRQQRSRLAYYHPTNGEGLFLRKTSTDSTHENVLGVSKN